MNKFFAAQYYSRPEIQKAILSFCKNREVGVMYDGYFGSRPDVIEYLSDIRSLVTKGVFSFHISEERWSNPLLLENTNMSEEDKMNNRVGWDLILDLDGVDFVYSKIAGKIIVDFLDELGVKNVSVKFSGNKGFHIGVPFEAFSKNIIGIGETRNLFPQIARKIASFFIYELKEKISKAILEHDGSIQNVSKKYEIPTEDLIVEEYALETIEWKKFDYMKVIEIDTILISTRHLFRAPYSLNEKSGLVSIPLRNDRIIEFDKSEAKPQNVNPQMYKDFEFLRYDDKYGRDADILLIKANEDDYLDMVSTLVNSRKTENFAIEINEKVEMKDFPRSIKFILENKFSDGKKRALFVLLTFLYSVKWEKENIKAVIYEWNDKQEGKLKDQYIKAQISWFDAQSKIISTPNFDNDNYYKGIGVPLNVINEDKSKFKVKVKNPLHYVFLMLEEGKSKKK